MRDLEVMEAPSPMLLPFYDAMHRKSATASPRGEPSNRADVDQSHVLVTFTIDALAWGGGRIVYQCSLCGATDNAGPTTNAAVHNEMRDHLRQRHRLKGTSGMRSESTFTDGGAISSVDFLRPH
jgi:hypothetical protein